jgi:hypothetical protein
MGVGIIVRDHDKKLLATIYLSKLYIIDLVVAVALAAWEA